MSKQRSRRAVLRAAGALGIAGLAGCTGGSSGSTGGTTSAAPTTTSGGSGGAATTAGGSSGGGVSGTMTIFHAGSLSAPFSAAQTQIESKYDVQVNQEAKGSVGSTKKITEQGRAADVLAVSDFRLIRDMMMGQYADWYGIFTTNAMAIAYTDQSTGADSFSTDNWWEVLTRNDVKFGHSDPAVDPNGYRSNMAMQLGAIPFQGKTLYDDATRKQLLDQAIVPSGTETDLIGQLKSGELDYAWEYKSAGASHDVNVIDLQPTVNLAKATSDYADHYAKAVVHAGGHTYTGAPIAYGITVPSVAKNPAAGAAWVEFMITDPGKGILTDNGFSPVQQMVAPKAAESAVPETVAANSTFKASLGPLDL